MNNVLSVRFRQPGFSGRGKGGKKMFKCKDTKKGKGALTKDNDGKDRKKKGKSTSTKENIGKGTPTKNNNGKGRKKTGKGVLTKGRTRKDNNGKDISTKGGSIKGNKDRYALKWYIIFKLCQFLGGSIKSLQILMLVKTIVQHNSEVQLFLCDDINWPTKGESKDGATNNENEKGESKDGTTNGKNEKGGSKDGTTNSN